LEDEMELNTFEELEKKIDQVLSLVDRLKMENEELKTRNMELQKRLEEKESIVHSLKEESEQYQEIKTEVTSFREKEDHIRSKVESLLQKLKEFEDMA
jgi:FtsZ-binding cell division protein ZapB